MSNGVPSQQVNLNHPAVVIVQMVLQFLTMVVVTYVATLGNKNAERLDQVGEKQEVAADRGEAVKVALEKKRRDDIQSTEIQLWSTWKYLDSIAANSAAPKDQIKAAEAKRVYDEFVKQNPR